MSLKSSMRAFDRETDRIAEREERHFEEHGHYSECAGCGGECNPSNVHADGRKFCDDCWELSDEQYGSLTPHEERAVALHEKWQRQMVAAPVPRHSTRVNFMRYAERVAKEQPVVNGSSDQTYQMFMNWYGANSLSKTLTLQAVMAEAVSRRQFVIDYRAELAAMVKADLHSNQRTNRCPKRLRERCNTDEILSRFADWNPNSHTDMKAMEYLQTLRGVLGYK